MHIHQEDDSDLKSIPDTYNLHERVAECMLISRILFQIHIKSLTNY